MAFGSPIAFEWQHGALLRATTDPGGLDLPRDLDLFGPAAAAQARAWLEDVWRRAEVRDVIGAASPVLCEQIDGVLAGQQLGARRVRRTVVSLASYLLRWQRRSTPFGLFAGVAPARIGPSARVSWGHKHATMVRADADWLADVVVRLQACGPLLERLPVVGNDAGQLRGGRYVVPGQPADGRALLMAPIEVSVNHSRPVAAVLAAARTPIRYGELRAKLTAQFASAGADQVDALLGGLIEQNLLITGLWAPMTELDALGHVCSELDAAGARDIPEIADAVFQLYAIRDELAAQDAAAPWSERIPLVKRMRVLSDIAPVPLLVDTAVDCDLQIPEQVAQEAAEAVSVLYRLTPYPFGYPQWRDYHRQFRARYGPGAVVPAADLVADSGLGLPAGYLGSARGRGPRQMTDRDEKLLALIQQAMLAGDGEIVLTRRVIADLAAGDDSDLLLVSRAEVSVEIHAASLDAMEAGAFRLVVTGTPRPGSSMAGRGIHLLPGDEQTLVAATYDTTDPETTAAQLSFAPRRRRNENVARLPQLLPRVIALGEHRPPGDDVIPLADLAVTADARRFHLVQLSTGRRVEPRVPHALEAAVHTPPLARFLAEITTARSAVYKAFDFGAAARLPYLPRVRFKNTVLASARWLLTADDLPARSAGTDAWETHLAAWRRRLRVPDFVAMVEHDQRLPLDLTHPVHRLLLRTRLDGAKRLELRETADPQDLAWLGRPHELLLPLALKAPAAPTSRPSVHPARAAAGDTGHLPGRSPFLYAQLHGHPGRFDEILTEHLPALTDALEGPPWWFGRHREMARPESDQHLALYVRLPDPGAYGPAAERVRDWADDLRRQRLLAHLTLATYEPQEGRYGYGEAMGAAQGVFAADSAAALAQIRTAPGGTHPQVLAAASMVNLTVCFAPSTEEALHWLVGHLPQEHGRLDKTLREQTLTLATPDHDHAALRTLPGGEDVAAAWQARATALDVYRQHLATERDSLTILRSLLHQHHVRAIGVDPDHEAVTHRLVRTYALRHTTRRSQ